VPTPTLLSRATSAPLLYFLRAEQQQVRADGLARNALQLMHLYPGRTLEAARMALNASTFGTSEHVSSALREIRDLLPDLQGSIDVNNYFSGSDVILVLRQEATIAAVSLRDASELWTFQFPRASPIVVAPSGRTVGGLTTDGRVLVALKRLESWVEINRWHDAGTRTELCRTVRQQRDSKLPQNELRGC
jgi:hypothetical protein